MERSKRRSRARPRRSEKGVFFGLPKVMWALVATSGIAAGAAGCERDGAPFDCECAWLTDYDDAAKQSARVCARDEREAPAVAKGCAQLSAPAPIQSCTCARAASSAPCRPGCRD